MGRPRQHSRIYLSVAGVDARLQAQLVRHLAAPSANANWEVTSRRSVTGGDNLEATVLRAIIEADIVVIIASAAYFDDVATRREMDLALKRFAAGELHLIVLHAMSCLLDERLAAAMVVAPPSFSGRGRESFWRTSAARIADFCEMSPPGQPRYEDEENREIGEALRTAFWTVASRAVHDFSALQRHQASLRTSEQLRPGDILGQRFHVRRRIGTPGRERWEGYDFLEQQSVEIHWIDLVDVPRWVAGANALRQWVALEHPGVVRVLTTTLQEPGLQGAYFVLERFVGRPLHEAILGGQVSGLIGIEVLGSIAGALAAIHQRGLVHGAIALDTIHVGQVDMAKGEPRCKLEPGCNATGFQVPGRSHPICAAQDIMDLGLTILTCLHGGVLPSNATSVQLRRILQMSAARPELKALLARSFSADTAASTDLARLGELLRGAPLQRASASTGWFDLEMRPVAGGVSWLGAGGGDVRARPTEKPARRVIIESFELCIYPVTQRLYKLITGINPSAHADESAPVHNVSFRDAVAFCNRLSMLHGFHHAYDLGGADVTWRPAADGYRLPTETEWETAARADSGALFPWGAEEPGERVCWNGPGNSLGVHNRKAPSPVWDHPEGVTPTGFFDMVGNVWEWCWDWFAPFDEWAVEDDEPLVEPIGPSLCRLPEVRVAVPGGAYRVLRGGAWNLEDSAALRTTVRSTEVETARDPDIGFRLARGPKQFVREIALRDRMHAASRSTARHPAGPSPQKSFSS